MSELDNPDNTDSSDTPDNSLYSYEKLSDLADAGELTEEKLQEVLNGYAKAFQEEFEKSVSNSPENVEEYTRDYFKKNVATAAAQIVYLSNNAFSESVKLRAAQMVVSEALKDSRADGDPIRELLTELAKNDPTPDQHDADKPDVTQFPISLKRDGLENS